jgi:hypothetical protein
MWWCTKCCYGNGLERESGAVIFHDTDHRRCKNLEMVSVTGEDLNTEKMRHWEVAGERNGFHAA